MPKYLVVKGFAGLGNRLASACNAIEYANKTGRTILIDWSDTMFSDGKRNVFPDYFSINNVPAINTYDQIPEREHLSVYPSPYQPDISVHHYSLYWNWRHPMTDFLPIPYQHLPRGRLAMLSGYWFFLPPGTPQPTSALAYLLGMFDPHNIPRGEFLPHQTEADVVVYADYIPRFAPNTLCDFLVLEPAMLNRIDVFAKRSLGDDAVGIHVRKTDKKPKGSDAIERIVRLLEEKDLAQRPIFISSDDDETVDQLNGRFPNLLLARTSRNPAPGSPLHISAERNRDPAITRTVLEESIIDMWLLSRCEYLFYQGNSAFTVPSRRLHQAPDKCFNWDAI
jgi:hypothetical protein